MSAEIKLQLCNGNTLLSRELIEREDEEPLPTLAELATRECQLQHYSWTENKD